MLGEPGHLRKCRGPWAPEALANRIAEVKLSVVRTYGFAGKPAPIPEVLMAIYSLHHSSIGKSTQDEPYTAAAHIRYITRTRALGRIDGERMPTQAFAGVEIEIDPTPKPGQIVAHIQCDDGLIGLEQMLLD